MTRRKFRTPPTLPEGTQCRGIVIPASKEWLGIYSDALLELTRSYNYLQVEPTDLTPEETAELAYAQYVAWLNSVCSGGACPPPNVAGNPIIRISPTTGKFEQLDDDAETWIEPTGDLEIPAIQPRAETTEEERICAAAANAAFILHTLYDATLALWEDGIAPLAAFEQFGELAGEIANAVLAVVLGVFAPFVGTVWAIFYTTMEWLTLDTWTTDFEDRLACLFREYAVYTDGVVTFDFMGVQGGLFTSENTRSQEILLLGQVLYLLSIIGADGLNLAGETTGVTGECGDCGAWCYEFDFLTDSGSFGNVTVYNTSGTVFCGSSGGGTYSGGTGWTVTRTIGRNFTRSNITAISLDVVAGSGSGAPLAGFEIYDPQGGRAYDRDYGVVSTTSNASGTYTLTWSGNKMASEIAFLRCTSSGSTVYKKLRIEGVGTNPFGTSNC